jgi:hypothetical protein
MALQRTKVARKRRSDSTKAKRQQQDRRKDGLFKKACEYAVECDADVYISIRIKKNGRILTFNSDLTRAWPIPDSQIVRCSLGMLPIPHV